MTALTINGVTVHHGDSREVLKGLPDNSVDSVVCDPPYGLGKAPSPEMLRHVLTEWMAGRDVEPTGSGFMGKKWDAFVPGPPIWAECLRVLKPGGHLVAFFGTRTYDLGALAVRLAGFEVRDMLAWLYGQGFPKNAACLKPALEPIVFARKPLAGTVKANVGTHGTGGLNIDGCRIEAPEGLSGGGVNQHGDVMGWGFQPRRSEPHAKGRWPANVIHDGSDEVVGAFPQSISRDGRDKGVKKQVNVYGGGWSDEPGASAGRRDVGSSARFFYAAKASKADRAGSKHPTVKPIDLPAWLARLITPPGGVVLDPFAGSGTTGAACVREGFRAILIEREEEYFNDIVARLKMLEPSDGPLFEDAA